MAALLSIMGQAPDFHCLSPSVMPEFSLFYTGETSGALGGDLSALRTPTVGQQKSLDLNLGVSGLNLTLLSTQGMRTDKARTGIGERVHLHLSTYF